MEDSYKGITLEGEEYKIKIQCKDDKQRQMAINFLGKENHPYLVEGLEVLLKRTGNLEKDYDIFERLIKELAE